MGKRFDASLTQERMEKHTAERVLAMTLSGAAAGVWIGREKRCGVSIGWRDPVSGIKMTEDTVFRLASMTKPISGVAAMIQWERGLIDLDVPITRWLPEFGSMRVAEKIEGGRIVSTVPAQRLITPRMLLTHSSGLGSGRAHELEYERFDPLNFSCLAEAVRAYHESILDFQPGTAQGYSAKCGLDVIVRIVELTADMPYEEFLKKNVFEPLGMKDTGYTLSGEQCGRVAEMVTADGGFTPMQSGRKRGFEDYPEGYTGGGGGLLSTLADYGRFAGMLAGGGTFDDVKILNEATVDLMSAPQLPPTFEGVGDSFNWGLSMRACPVQNAPSQPLTGGSFGWSGAYGTHFWVDRKKSLYAVYMSNIRNGMGAGAPTAFEFERDVMAGFGECE